MNSYSFMQSMKDFMDFPSRKMDKLPRPAYGNKSSKKAMFKHKKIGRIT